MPCSVFALCFAISVALAEHGIALPQRDAILRYIRVESNFEPCISGRSGAWLFQWVGERRRRLGPTCPPWQRQVEFALAEATERRFERFWQAQTAAVATDEWRRHFGRGR